MTLQFSIVAVTRMWSIHTYTRMKKRKIYNPVLQNEMKVEYNGWINIGAFFFLGKMDFSVDID